MCRQKISQLHKMSLTRIISRLDIKGNNLVKGINLEGLRVIGSPEDFAKKYYLDGIDEIFYQDVVASLYGRNSLLDIISKTAKDIFIPLTVSGGIRKIEDIKNVLRNGADKISMNTAAIENPNLISEAVKIFGSSTITITVEIIKDDKGNYIAFTDNGRNNTNFNAFDWIRKLEDYNVGEIVVTFIETEGTGNGIDIEFAKKIKESICTPLILHGGFGTKEYILDVINEINPSGIAIASIFHYSNLDLSINKKFNYGHLDFLNKKKNSTRFKSLSVSDLKQYLKENLKDS